LCKGGKRINLLQKQRTYRSVFTSRKEEKKPRQRPQKERKGEEPPFNTHARKEERPSFSRGEKDEEKEATGHSILRRVRGEEPNFSLLFGEGSIALRSEVRNPL